MNEIILSNFYNFFVIYVIEWDWDGFHPFHFDSGLMSSNNPFVDFRHKKKEDQSLNIE